MPTDSDLALRVSRLENDTAALYELVGNFRDEVRTRFEQVDARFGQVDARFEQVDARFEQVDARFEQVDARFDRIETTLAEVLRRLPEPS